VSKLKGYLALSPGELVKDGFFTLFESVGALEVHTPGSHSFDTLLSATHADTTSRSWTPRWTAAVSRRVSQ
jgi:hypothetical protein